MRVGLPLSELSEVAWADLGHSFGSADDVPELLQALGSADATQREHARDQLHASLDHQGIQRWDATLSAIPYLVGLAADPATPERGDLLRLLAELALGDTWWFQHDGFHPDLQCAIDQCSRPKACSIIKGRDIVVRGFPSPGDRLDMSEGSLERDVYDAVLAGLGAYCEAAADRDPDVRRSAAYLLAWLTTQTERSRPVLLELTRDADVSVRATAWLALSHATKRDPTCAETKALLDAAWSDHGDPLERRALALALVRLEDPPASRRVRPELLAWLRRGVPPVIPDGRFPWQRIDAAPFVFCTTYLGTAPDERAAVVAAAAEGLPDVTDEHDAADLTRWLLQVGLPGGDAPLVASTLPEDARRVLQAIAASPKCWYFSDTAQGLRSQGLPDTAEGLAAWFAD